MPQLYPLRSPFEGAASHASSRRRVFICIVVAAVLATFPPGSSPVGAATKKKTTTKTTPKAAKGSKKTAATKQPKLASLSENRKRQAEVRRQQANVAANLKELKSEDRITAQNLAALTDNLKQQNAKLGSANRALDEAEQEVAQAKAEAAETAAKIETLSGARRDAALDAYVRPQMVRLGVILNASDIATASRTRLYADMANRTRTDDLDLLLAAEQDNAIAVRKAEAAEKKRAKRKAAAAKRLAELATSRSRTEKYSAQVEDRLEDALYEAQSLKEINAIVSKEVAKQQAELAKQLKRARLSGAKSKGGSPGKALPDIPTGSTNGIVVAASIKGKLAAMIRHAASDGIYLTGGGYRSSAGQLAVRRKNCGTSSYAVYSMPSSSCRPPTAKPGRSQHERGLAIDFAQNGRALTRSSSAYRWLKQHAHKYGFYNLPSEAWHWSTTGR
jgi:D-alanyl-D-alanine carboxypeptidase